MSLLKSLVDDKFLLVDLVVDLLFLVDMLSNFRTTFVRDGELVLSASKIACNYLKGWFIVDFFSAIPFDIIVNLYRKSEVVCVQLIHQGAIIIVTFSIFN